MKNLKMIDEMTHDDFKRSRRSVRHLEVLNIFAYYKKALSHEQTAIIPIAVALTVLSIGLKHNSAGAGAATMYLATYVSAALCWCFLAATIFTKLDYAYSWQYLQLKRMTRELLSARSYDEMYSVLEKYAGTDFVILTDASTSDLDDLTLTCALIKCKELLQSIKDHSSTPGVTADSNWDALVNRNDELLTEFGDAVKTMGSVKDHNKTNKTLERDSDLMLNFSPDVVIATDNETGETFLWTNYNGVGWIVGSPSIGVAGNTIKNSSTSQTYSIVAYN